MYKQTTQVPNIIFDQYLPTLSIAELKVLLIVIRQTLGWHDKKTGKRKARDRISSYQFRQKTGLSRRVISKAIQSLLEKQIIEITNFAGDELSHPAKRKGKVYLYFALAKRMSPASLPYFRKTINNRPACEYLKFGNPRFEGADRGRTFSGHIGYLINNKL